MPFSPLRKNSSPTIAPITESPAAIRNPPKIAGSAPGNCRRNMRVRREAPRSVNRSC